MFAPYYFAIPLVCPQTLTTPAPTAANASNTSSSSSFNHSDSISLITGGASEATSTLSTAAVIGSAVAGMDAADAQMLVSILGSPCVCSTTSPRKQRDDGSVLLLALSPFSPLGSTWAAIGNSLLCCVLVGLHAFAAKMLIARSNRRVDAPPQQQQHLLLSLLDRWFYHHSRVVPNNNNVKRSEQTKTTVAARLRFPNLSVTLLMLLLPGVIRGVVDVANTLHNNATSTQNEVTEGGDESPQSTVLGGIAIAVGVVFAIFVGGAVEAVVYRHADAEITTYCTTSTPSSSSLCAKSRRCLLHFEVQQQPLPQKSLKLFFGLRLPRSSSSVALPRGSWQPPNAKSSYGGIVSPYVEQWRRAWMVLPAANIVVQVLNGIDGNGGTCDVLQGLTLCVLACACAFIAYARPHRALLASYLVCASLVLTMVTALLGLLCRHGTVSSDAVSGFGVFASVAMLVFKLYHVLMFFVEKRQSPKLSANIESTFLSNGSDLSNMSERSTRPPHSGANRRRSPQLQYIVTADAEVSLWNSFTARHSSFASSSGSGGGDIGVTSDGSFRTNVTTTSSRRTDVNVTELLQGLIEAICDVTSTTRA